MILPKIVKSYNQNNNIIRYWEIVDGDCVIFQSYSSIMFTIIKGKLSFNDNIDNYTQTTCKYLYKALNWVVDYIDNWNLSEYEYDTNIKIKNTIIGLLESNNTKRAIMQYMIDTGNKIND